jgi:hypothetical protein
MLHQTYHKQEYDQCTIHSTPFCKREINLQKEYECIEWCKIFKCTERDLRRAIRRVGNNLVAVSLYLQQH